MGARRKGFERQRDGEGGEIGHGVDHGFEMCRTRLNAG
jgi:hypothetical protein